MFKITEGKITRASYRIDGDCAVIELVSETNGIVESEHRIVDNTNPFILGLYCLIMVNVNDDGSGGVMTPVKVN